MKDPRNQRQRNRRLTAVLIAVFLVLVVIMSAFLVLRCLEFDENGAHVIDRYGVLEAEGSASGLVDYSRYGSGYSAEDDSEEEEKKDDSSYKKETAANTASSLRAITVSAQDLTYDDDYKDQILSLKAQGVIDTVIVDLKDSEGNLSEQITTSALDATTVQTVYSDEFPQAIADLKAGGCKVIGRVYAFLDNTATRQNSDLSCWYGAAGTNWLDANNNRWLDPTDSMSVQYICDIVSKGVEIGCDEILLADLCFPQGSTDLISFDNETSDYSAVINNAYEQIVTAANGAPVGIYVDQDADTRAIIGVDLSTLGTSVSRIMAPYSMAETDGALASLSDLICDWYTDRDTWSATQDSAVYDSNGDIYQIFYLGA